MNAEQKDFETWSADWRSPSSEDRVSPSDIRRRVRRFTTLVIASWVLGLSMLAALTLLAWHDRRPPVIAGAVVACVFIVIGAVVDYRNFRGAWKAAGDSTEDYIEQARRQAVAFLRSLRFGWYVLAGQVIFFAWWIPWVLAAKPDSTPARYVWAFGYLFVLVAVFAIGLVWMIRRAERRVERLERIRKELAAVDQAA